MDSDFDHLFQGDDGDDSVLDREWMEEAAKELGDIQRFAGTETYKRLRARLEHKMGECTWTLGMTQEQASTLLIFQTAIKTILRDIDSLISLAMEKQRG